MMMMMMMMMMWWALFLAWLVVCLATHLHFLDTCMGFGVLNGVLAAGALLGMAPKVKKRPAGRGGEQETGDKQNLGESAGGGGGEVAAGESGGAAGSGERPKRRRKKQEQICLARVCTLKAKPESKFCGIHTHPQTYGTVEEVPTAEEEQTQNVEGPLAVVPREEAPVFQLRQTNLDIGMFFLRLPIQEIAKVSAFWQSQQGPTLNFFQKGPAFASYTPIPRMEGGGVWCSLCSKCRAALASTSKPLQQGVCC